METFGFLMQGFAVALQPNYLLLALAGCFIGTLVGVLPGIGPSAGTAILLPLTFQLEPAGAIILLSAIYYGAQYGGTITSVLLSVPGEASSVVTCFDGYPMAQQGRAGSALCVAAVGSFVGGTVATFGLVVAAPTMVAIALQFGPAEQFALMVLGLSLIMVLAGKSVVKALIMGMLGLILGMVGMDPTAGVPRFTFGQMHLLGGLDLVVVVMGLFGIGEILVSLEKKAAPAISASIRSLLPTREEARQSVAPIARGTLIGFALGLIPGMQPSLSTFVSYMAERRLSRTPERFGNGAIEGVAGPETANNAFVNAALIPLFTLGIPTTATIAVLQGAFMMHGVLPGPLLFRDHPDIIWPVIASLYVGNALLLVLNLPLIGIWVSLLRVPYALLYVLILIFTLIGAYSITGSSYGVGVMIFFGVVGYALRKLDFPLAPLVLTFVLGPLIERALRASLQMSNGSPSILFESWTSTVLLVAACLILLSSVPRLSPVNLNEAREDNE